MRLIPSPAPARDHSCASGVPCVATDTRAPARGAAGLAILGFALLAPAAARADSGKLPQMDFANPLTVSQLVWMLVILVALYLALAFWGLPRIRTVIEFRRGRIRTDLDAARLARASADTAIRELDRAIAAAREDSDRTVRNAIDAARARARAEEATLNARLETELARAETQIANARATALSALLPIAEEVAHGLVERLSGEAPDRARLDATLAAIQAA